MGVQTLDSSVANNIVIMDDDFEYDGPLNGTDARRRLEDKIEELRLQKELKEFDFDD
ncbi:MAG: hypothetical protein K6L81_04870 [Agarilytica sp.]